VENRQHFLGPYGTCSQADPFMKKYKKRHIYLKCTGCESKAATLRRYLQIWKNRNLIFFPSHIAKKHHKGTEKKTRGAKKALLSLARVIL